MAALAQLNISAVDNESNEVQPLLINTRALKSQHFQKLSKKFPRYKLAKISEKGAIFMIIWNLFYATALFCSFEIFDSRKNTVYMYIPYIVAPSVSILYPIVGLAIDVWIGTFRIIKLSLYFLLIAIIMKHIYMFIILSDVVLYLSTAAWSLAGICYLASIIPLTTTQLIGASGEQLSLAIYWLLWGNSVGLFLSRVLPCLFHINDQQSNTLLSILSVAFSL